MTEPLRVPGSPAEITRPWLENALAVERGTITGFDVEIIGQDRGFTGIIARLSLDYNLAPEVPPSIVAKFPLAARSEESSYRRASTTTAELSRAYVERAAREAWFYEHFSDPGIDSIPACYFCHADVDSGEVVLLLEDLSAGVPGDALSGCSVDGVRAVLDGIGQIHARFWDSGGFVGTDWLPGWQGMNEQWVERFSTQVDRVIQRFGDRLPEDIIRLMLALPAHYSRILAELGRAPQTLIHGDLHLDNVIFTQPASRLGTLILDWQGVMCGPAMVDIAGFVADSLSIGDRRAREDQLLAGYHERLHLAGIDDYDLDRMTGDYLRVLLVRLAGITGWLARVQIEELEGRERKLVENLFYPGRVMQAPLDREVERRLRLD